MDDFRDYCEVKEIKTYHIKARNKADAERILSLAISSQDEILNMIGRKWGYEARVSHLIARDWPTNKVE